MIIKKDKDTIETYLTDASNLKGSSSRVIIPENKTELIDIIKELNHQNQNFVVSGAGTGLTGGKVPIEETIISIEKLDKIIHINPKQKIVTVQPGVTLSQLEEDISQYNLFLPPNPTEKNSSIGGNVSNNSSGSRSFKYGSIRNYVVGLEVILPNGDTLKLARGSRFAQDNNIEFLTEEHNSIIIKFDEIQFPAIKHSGGYFLMDSMDSIELFIGSEGTLGIINEISLTLSEKPEKVLGLLVFFDEEGKLFDFTDEIREKSLINNKHDIHYNNGISSRLIEFFDSNSLTLLKDKYTQIPNGSIGAVWIEQEYTEDKEIEILEKWFDIIAKYSHLGDSTWVATNDKDHNIFRDFRHELPLRVNEIISKNGVRKIGSDTAVPKKYFREYYYYLKYLLIELKMDFVIFGHIGDCHLHANLFPKNDDEYQKALEFYDKILAKSIELGGTVSAEHGIGKIKKKYLKQMLGVSAIESMRMVKNILDPKNLLGKGNLFD